MDTIKQLQWRYATKSFDASKTLSAEKLNIIKQAFNLTATSFGLQTLHLVIVKDKTLRESLQPHSYNQSQVVSASHLLVICIQEDIIENDVIDYYNNIKAIRNTTEETLKPYREQLIAMMANKTVEERQRWSKNQAYIALGNLMTVCAMENIDACPMEGFIPEKYDNILQLKQKGLKSALIMPIGYRAETDMFSTLKKVRKSINQTVTEI